MKISEITAFLESIAPAAYQENYDNAGLITGNAEAEINKALVCIDSTEEVVDEAIKKKCGLIIAHHPIIFSGIKKLTGRNYVERTIVKAIKNDIAIYAIHTNLDNVIEGVNAKIAEKLGLTNTRILLQKPEASVSVGAGMIGELPKETNEAAFLKKVKAMFNCGCVRYTNLLGRPIKRVAACGGSGSFLLNDAIKQNADIFITADFKYHQFFDADGKIVIADIGHFESEQFTAELLYEKLTKNFRNFAVLFSDINTNPVNYI